MVSSQKRNTEEWGIAKKEVARKNSKLLKIISNFQIFQPKGKLWQTISEKTLHRNSYSISDLKLLSKKIIHYEKNAPDTCKFSNKQYFSIKIKLKNTH